MVSVCSGNADNELQCIVCGFIPSVIVIWLAEEELEVIGVGISVVFVTKLCIGYGKVTLTT